MKQRKEGQEEKFVFALWLAKLDITNGAKIFSTKKEELETGLAMRNNLRELNAASVSETEIKKAIPVRTYWLAAAAVLAIIAGVLFYSAEKPANNPAFSEFSTGANQYKQITLPDGSTIRLHKESAIKVPDSFNDTIREVFLNGEAFFSIARNEKKPFLVHAEQLDIRILGTSFNVRQNKEKQETEIVVHTGKVAVQEKANKNNNWTLAKGIRLVHSSKKMQSPEDVIVKIDTLRNISQQRLPMVFRNERLASICKKLEQRYEVSIAIHSADMKEKRLHIKLKDESLSQVLELLGKAAGFNYTISGNQVDIVTKN